MNPRQKGKPTYRKDLIINIFDDSYMKKLLEKIGLDVYDNFNNVESNVSIFPSKTKYGYSGNLRIRSSDFVVDVGMFRDGWKIKIGHVARNRYDMARLDKIKFKILGDINTNGVWTQETDKVSDIVIQIIKEINDNMQKGSKT